MASRNNSFEEHGVTLTKQGQVTWASDSKDHPRNWGVWPKTYTAVVVIWLEAYMTAISSAGTATAKAASKEYGASMVVGILCFVTTYLVAQAFGGVLLAPISEIFGRRTIYIIGTAVFGVASVITGVPHHLAGATIGRLLQGIAASIPATVSFGNFHDMYEADTRVWVVYWYTLGGMGGLALGPIYSSYVTDLLGWRWVYHISAIVSAISIVAAFFIRESNADQLLQAKTNELRKLSGDTTLQTESERKDPKEASGNRDQNKPSLSRFKAFVRTQLLRPLHFLVSEPLIILCAILCSIAFSLLYACTESFPLIYTLPPFGSTFNTEPKLSLPFLAIFLGLFFNILPRLYDRYTIAQQRRLQRRIVPETKIHSIIVACPIFAIGLWILAWTIPQRVTSAPWPLSMLGLVCIGFAANDFSYVLFGYIADSYAADHAASAVGAVALARTLAAGIFPLFVTDMYEGLGNNVATTIIAVAATLFCVAPWVLLEKGEKLRKRSKWAVKGDKCLWEENKHMRQDGQEMGERQMTFGPFVLAEEGQGSEARGESDSGRKTGESESGGKTRSNAGTRGSTRMSTRSSEWLAKHKRTWSETRGDVQWTYTKVQL